MIAKVLLVISVVFMTAAVMFAQFGVCSPKRRQRISNCCNWMAVIFMAIFVVFILNKGLA
jgi:hypothetical protein